MNESVINVFCYERGLLWTGLLWAVLLRTWSVLSGLLLFVWYERVCFEREPSEQTSVRPGQNEIDVSEMGLTERDASVSLRQIQLPTY